MNYTVFVDGQEGTTGLEIHQRLALRDDILLIEIDPQKRKDPEERRKCLNQADIVFLCLPDAAAKEAVSFVTNPKTRIIDGSTAHRTLDSWAYGIPELNAAYKEKILHSARVSVPGCHATGFILLVYPLISSGILAADSFLSCTSMTGHSGAGKKMIEAYQSPEEKEFLGSPCHYAFGLTHKHLPEMMKHAGLDKAPVFMPVIHPFYRGMTISVPIHTAQMQKKADAAAVHALFAEHYAGCPFVKVKPHGIEAEFPMGFLNADGCKNTNLIELYVFGHAEQLLLLSRFDNLGKGASGAAIQNLNLMLGRDEAYTLL